MNPTPRESSRLVPATVLLAVIVLVALVAHTMRIPPPTERDGGTYLGQLPDGRALRIHRIVEPGEPPWDHWVDSPSGTWAIRDSSTGEVWGPAERQWGSNTIVQFQTSADGASGIASLTTAGTAGSSSSTHSILTVPMVREFRHRGAVSRFGFQLGRFGARIGALAQVPAFDVRLPFEREVSDQLWRDAARAMREFMAQRWEQQWDSARMDWPVSLSDWNLNWHVEPRLVRSNLVSVAVFWYPERGGVGNPTHWKGMTFEGEAKRCVALSWSDLFPEDSGWEVFLTQRCGEVLTRHLDHETAVGHIPAENFTLTDHGLQVLFDPYEVASGAEGAQVVHIPWSDLRPFLRPIRASRPGEKFLPRPIIELIEPTQSDSTPR